MVRNTRVPGVGGDFVTGVGGDSLKIPSSPGYLKLNDRSLSCPIIIKIGTGK